MSVTNRMSALAGLLLLSAAVSIPAASAQGYGATYGSDTYHKMMGSMKMMKIIDKDADHKVTRAEFMAYHEAMFAKMDKNKDGVIDQDEWLAMQKKKKTDGS